MKTLLVNFVLIFMVLGCSNSNQNDYLSIYQNNLNGQISVQETIEINVSLYPSANISNLDLPLHLRHLTLKKELYLSGRIHVLDKKHSAIGSFRSDSFKIDSTNENIIEKFSGILTLNNNELIFYSGSIIINIENKNYEGVFNIANGTGKYRGCYANLNVKGVIDFNSGYNTMIASGNISMYNNN